MFDAQFEVDAFDGTARLRTTQNGSAWSALWLRTPAEAKAVCDALQTALMGKLGNPDHTWDCMIHDGYGLCNCGALTREE